MGGLLFRSYLLSFELYCTWCNFEDGARLNTHGGSPWDPHPLPHGSADLC